MPEACLRHDVRGSDNAPSKFLPLTPTLSPRAGSKGKKPRRNSACERELKGD
jgi:hypothetical protein